MNLAQENTNTYISVKNRKWKKYQFDHSRVNYIKQKLDTSFEIAEILSTKNINDHELEHYLDPKIKYFLNNLPLVKDLEKASLLVIESIKKQEKISVFGDYDVDGATSSAILRRFLKSTVKNNIDIYIPDRIKEGYGLNIDAVKTIHAQGTKVLITVDCGSSSHEAIAEGKKLGLKIIVIDHHICDANLPKADAIINPNRLDDHSGYNHLAAVGVTFLFTIKLYQLLFKDQLCERFDLLSLLDLVALGTICDVVPLIGINRALVNQGLKLMNSHLNPGIKALLEVSNNISTITTYHLGFVIGPRINAGGRVGESNLGAALLSSNDHDKSFKIANKLHLYNEERKAIEMRMIEEAMSEARSIDLNSPIICIGNTNWHQGIIGIVAGKLKDSFNKPVAVISFDSENIGKASCRSIYGIDFGDAVIKAKEKGILINGGGHAMAAGFTVKKEKMDELNDFFIQSFQSKYSEILSSRVNNFSSHISLPSITIDFIKKLHQLGPFGSNNAQPQFMLNNVSIIYCRIIKGDHVSCVVTSCDSGSSLKLKAIAFRSASNVLGEVLLSKKYNLNLIVTLNINRWKNSENPEMIINDAFIN